jgi:hypothetical protein
MFYLTGFAFALWGYLKHSVGVAGFGGLAILGGVYYTVQWVRAKSKDSN